MTDLSEFMLDPILYVSSRKKIGFISSVKFRLLTLQRGYVWRPAPEQFRLHILVPLSCLYLLLLLSNKLTQHTSIISTFQQARGPGTQVLCQVLTRLQSRHQPGCLLTWRLHWGRRDFQAYSYCRQHEFPYSRMTEDFLLAVGGRRHVTVPRGTCSSLLHELLQHLCLLHQAHKESLKSVEKFQIT